MNLFQINQEIMTCIDMESGEILDEAKLDELAMARDEKVENICLWIKNLTAEAAALKAEKDAFTERQKAAEVKADSLKKYLQAFLAGGTFKTAKVEISYRTSEAVEVADGAALKLPEEFLTFKKPEANKTELKKALKAGREFEGVQLVKRQNMQIK